jgi:tRNA pseudouridine38-40 synthase
MARYQIIFGYDGTDFVGSQRQAQARTVQGELENALRRLNWTGKTITLAGRTDTGVHAAGQVAAVDMDWTHSPEELLKALNASLPLDMAAQAVRIAPERFHPRFDALSRCYRYRICVRPMRDPLRERYAWRVWPLSLESDLLQRAAQALTDRHDFAAFGTPPRAGSSTVRTVVRAEWQRRDDEWVFTVEADAFLYRMVRRMVYIQVAAAQGRLKVETIGAALQTPSPLPAGLAPASGLTLLSVTYPPFDDLESNL